MFALRRKLLISVHTSFDMNLMKDSRSFINRGQAETVCLYISDVMVPQKRHWMGSFCCGTKVHSLATMRAEWKDDLLWLIVHIFDIFYSWMYKSESCEIGIIIHPFGPRGFIVDSDFLLDDRFPCAFCWENRSCKITEQILF